MGLFRRKQKEPRLTGLAGVLELGQTGPQGPGHAGVRLKLLVCGEGEASRELEVETEVFDTATHLVIPGALIPVTVAAGDPDDVKLDWDGGWWPSLESGHSDLVSRLGKQGRLELAVADPERVRERLLVQRGLEQRPEATKQRLDDPGGGPPDEVVIHRVGGGLDRHALSQ